MALLAYEEPEKSPMFHLLSLDYRQQVADSLNRAVLGMLLKFLHASVCHMCFNAAVEISVHCKFHMLISLDCKLGI